MKIRSGIEKASVKKNFIYNLMLQVASIIVPLVTTPYVSRTLGADHIGQYSYATAIVTYFSTAAVFGSATFGQKAIAFARDDKEKLSNTFWNIQAFRTIASILAMLAYFITINSTKSTNAISIIVSLNIVNVIFDINWFFQGIEYFKRTVIRSLIIKFLGMFLIFLFVHSQNDTAIYTAIMVGSIIVGNIVLWLYLPGLISFPKERIKPFLYLKDMWLMFVPTIATQVYMILDKSMIGWITHSAYQNGCYEQSEKIVRQAITLVTAIGAVVLPRVANLYYHNKLDEAKQYVYKAYHVVWILSIPICFGIIGIASVFIPIYLGRGFDLSITLFQIFAVLVVCVSLAYVTGFSYLIPTNQQNVYTIAVTISAIVNFILNSCLIPNYGASGAAIASVVAESVGTIVQIAYCINKKQLQVSQIFNTALKPITAGIVMYVVIRLLISRFKMSILGLLIEVLVGAGIYFIALIILKDNMMIALLKKIKSKVSK